MSRWANNKVRLSTQIKSSVRSRNSLHFLSTSLDSVSLVSWKEVVLIPLLKKSGLDSVFKNLRPVSNLAFISKLRERVDLIRHTTTSSGQVFIRCCNLRSRRHHSTDTALVKVANDILLNMNSQHVTLLVLLDLSAAFDTWIMVFYLDA